MLIIKLLLIVSLFGMLDFYWGLYQKFIKNIGKGIFHFYSCLEKLDYLHI